jgi:hypothetical protein
MVSNSSIRKFFEERDCKRMLEVLDGWEKMDRRHGEHC